MTFDVAVDGRAFRVSVVRTPEGWTVSVDGGPQRCVRGLRVGAAEWVLGVDDAGLRRVGVHVGGESGTAQVGGHGLALSVRDARAWRAATGGGGGRGEVRTPMPGVVTRVPVAVGDAVVAGQVLVVVEAMKMENELRAPVAGRVASVHAAAGTAVEGAAVLVVVEPA